MRILIDTHIWLWWINTPHRLSTEHVALLSDPSHTIYLSAASVWEVVIKHARGRLHLPSPPLEFVPSRMTRDRITGLTIEFAHVLQVAHLPLHHQDPFDRVIIAQAQVEGMPILTADRQFARYDVEVIQAG